MLKRLELKNFQAHRHLVVDFHPQITTIVGASDSGKSSIVRALRWLILNRPGGEAFIRDGAQQTQVHLTTDTNEITRERGKGKNSYTLNGKTLEAFGSAVPDEVQTALRIGELNFQNQHDAPFYFSESAGEVSRRLNQIINLGAIDDVLSYLNGRVRDTTSTLSVLQNRVRESRKRREELQYVAEMRERIQEVESLEKKAQEATEKASGLRALAAEVQTHTRRGQIAATAAESGKAAILAGERWVELRNKRGQLSIRTMEYELHAPTAHRKIPDLQPVERLATEWSRIRLDLGALSTAIEEVERFERSFNRDSKRSAGLVVKFTEEIGEVCPLCQQPIKTTK